MHYTLKPWCNAVLITLSGMVLVVCLFAGKGGSLLAIFISSLSGFLAGALQGSAIRGDSSKFIMANTALQVRAALTSSLQGKASIVLLWVFGFCLGVLFLCGDGIANLQSVVGSYAAFSMTRELAAFPALLKLSRSSECN